MKQPEIGAKVLDLRKKKGMTQEQLAELCGLTDRTIQRIEAGSADPRSYTLEALSLHLDYDFLSENQPRSLWAAALHLSSCICIVPVPILIWIVGRRYQEIDHDAKAVINFQLTMTAVFAILAVLVFVPAGAAGFLVENGLPGGRIITGSAFSLVLLICSGILCFTEGLINTMRILSGKQAKYIPSIKFISMK
ncbi:MAG: helix-turn-helix domain-containing protein [Spirochaetales bacterium]|nr:helix-turn-helix domain-containing protein [Spirochaetales bacterium]